MSSENKKEKEPPDAGSNTTTQDDDNEDEPTASTAGGAGASSGATGQAPSAIKERKCTNDKPVGSPHHCRNNQKTTGPLYDNGRYFCSIDAGANDPVTKQKHQLCYDCAHKFDQCPVCGKTKRRGGGNPKQLPD